MFTTITEAIKGAQREAVYFYTEEGDLPEKTTLRGKSRDDYYDIDFATYALIDHGVVNPYLLPTEDIRYAIVASHLDLVKDTRTMERVLAHDVTTDIVNQVLSQLEEPDWQKSRYRLYQKAVKKLVKAVLSEKN